MNSHPQGTTAALAEREQRLRELETQFHAERGMLQLQVSVVVLLKFPGAQETGRVPGLFTPGSCRG